MPPFRPNSTARVGPREASRTLLHYWNGTQAARFRHRSTCARCRFVPLRRHRCYPPRPLPSNGEGAAGGTVQQVVAIPHSRNCPLDHQGVLASFDPNFGRLSAGDLPGHYRNWRRYQLMPSTRENTRLNVRRKARQTQAVTLIRHTNTENSESARCGLKKHRLCGRCPED